MNKTSNTTNVYSLSCGENTIIMTEKDEKFSWNINGEDVGVYNLNKMICPNENCSENTSNYISNLKDPKILFKEFSISKILRTYEVADEIGGKILNEYCRVYKLKKITFFDNIKKIANNITLDIFNNYNDFSSYDVEDLITHENKLNHLCKLYGAPFVMEIIPKISAKSQFTENGTVDKFTWAVTVIKTHEPYCWKGRDSYIQTFLQEHASIIIEGIDEKDEIFGKDEKISKKGDYLLGKDGHFVYQGHLLEEGIADTLHPFDRKMKYVTKSETMFFPEKKVKNLIKKIKIDKKENKIKWTPLGINSIEGYIEYLFSKIEKINCIEYVCATLSKELDWKLKTAPLKILANLPSFSL